MKMEAIAQPEGLHLNSFNYGIRVQRTLKCENVFYKCDNVQLQLKKSKRITVRHFYSLVPMSVVSSPKATSQESSPGAPKVFR
jgi:hypothetical protein